MNPEQLFALSKTLQEVMNALEALNQRVFSLEREVYKIKTKGQDE